MDNLAAQMIGAGMTVEMIDPGCAYRIDGPAETLKVLAIELSAADSAYELAIERAPAETIRMASRLAPLPAYRRTVTVHSATVDAHRMVARAVDRGLSVSSIGVQRWSVTGRSAALAHWLAEALSRTVDQVLALHGWSPESIEAEDTSVMPFAVNVSLPDRRIETEMIDRDAVGNLTRVVQTERSLL